MTDVVSDCFSQGHIYFKEGLPLELISKKKASNCASQKSAYLKDSSYICAV